MRLKREMWNLREKLNVLIKERMKEDKRAGMKLKKKE
jgi:hypothetical protein